MENTQLQELKSNPLKQELTKLRIRETAQLVGYEKALEKHYKQIAYDFIQDNLEEYEMTLFPKINQYYKEKYIPSRKNCKDRYKYVMVTVNPKTSTDIGELMKCYEKCIKKKYILNSISCIEFTSEIKDNHNGNMHIHMRFEIHSKDPYRIKSEVYNTFKKITEPQCISIRYSNLKDSFIEYIKGKEKRDDKYVDKECMEITRQYRKLFQIPDVF